MIKFCSNLVGATLLCAFAIIATPATAATVDHKMRAASTATAAPTDISAARRHYRYVDNRWRVVRPYPTYGVYGPRPHYYRPWPYYVPFPFGFGVGFDPYYW
jgi:uncharacterized membrane protein YfcA